MKVQRSVIIKFGTETDIAKLLRNHKGQLVGDEDDDESSLTQLRDEV